MFTSTIRMGKVWPCDGVMVISARQTVLSISETANLLESSSTTVSTVFTEWCKSQWAAIQLAVTHCWEMAKEEVYGHSNNHSNKLVCKKNLRMDLNFEVDGLQQQKTTSGSTPISCNKKSNLRYRLPKLRNIFKKNLALSSFGQPVSIKLVFIYTWA